VASVQNEYSLLCRQFDTDWAELSVMEDVPLLAFSPLACGILSGKYQGDATPQGSRRSLNPGLSGRMGPRTLPITQVYLDIARKHGLDPCQMAIAFCQSRPFRTIPIVGATSFAQLANSLQTIALSPEVLADIAAAHRAHPRPY
jgi:aryl-alcohol dehydrogenase-like predicted oxidoreductase